MIEFCT